MKNFRFVVPFLALISTSALASMSDVPGSVDLYEDSGYKGPVYPDLIQEMKDLAKANSETTEVFVYGKSSNGLDLVGLRIRTIANPGANAPLVVVTGAIHGNEFLGIEDKLPAWVLGEGGEDEAFQKFFGSGGEMIFIPVMNPDGYVARERENARGEDLNRDFELKHTGHAGSTQPETIAYTAMLKNELSTTGRKLEFTLDYHCCIGAGILPWAYGKKVPLDAKDAPRYDQLSRLTKDILGTKSGTPWEILGYTADGSTVDYLLEHYGSVSIGYEGQFKKEHTLLSKHESFLEAVVGLINDGKL